MNLIRFLYFIATIVEVAKSSAEADDGSVLAQRLLESKHMVRGSGSGSNDEKETGNKEKTSSVNQSAKRMLEAVTKQLLKFISINDNDNCCCEEIFTASDGSDNDMFGYSCSIANDLVVIGASRADDKWPGSTGAAYLFHLDGTEVAKLTPGNDEDNDDGFGESVSMDEKVVVGTNNGDYVKVFSRNGTYERTIKCDECWRFGERVATLGNLIAVNGDQDNINKLFIYSTTEDGQLLKTLDQGSDDIYDVAMSEQFIVTTSWSFDDGKTFIYSNTSPDFPKIAEIEQGGKKVAVSGDRIVIGDPTANDNGAVWLYTTDGTLVKSLEDASSDSSDESSWFGGSVDITDDGAAYDNDQGTRSGSVFIYSAVTGEFIEKVLSPDGTCSDFDLFGYSVCASGSHYIVGARGDTRNGYQSGSAYLFQFSEE